MPAKEGIKTSKERIERMANMCATNAQAATAMGISPQSFGRLCREYGIETPYVRKNRELNECKKEKKPKEHLWRKEARIAFERGGSKG